MQHPIGVPDALTFQHRDGPVLAVEDDVDVDDAGVRGHGGGVEEQCFHGGVQVWPVALGGVLGLGGHLR